MKEVTVIFKSGATASFTANEFKTFKNGFGAMSQVEWNTEGLNKHLLHLNDCNVDAIFVEYPEEKEHKVVKQDDHPIEDVFGEEIKTDDVYYKFGEHIVLENNLKSYLIDQQNVECFQAQ
ncbi:hypothetical protein AAIE21_05125 [Paenibacillus sp. 102]|uniref:YqaI family protein n=1 Tax=Paenibacillus sp. 102 TaxID=3120823 RepID=UPI0031BB0F71